MRCLDHILQLVHEHWWWRVGDIVLEIDGHLIRTETAISIVLRDRIGRITLAMIAVDSATEAGRLRPQNSGRLRQARDLFAKVWTHIFVINSTCVMSLTVRACNYLVYGVDFTFGL